MRQSGGRGTLRGGGTPSRRSCLGYATRCCGVQSLVECSMGWGRWISPSYLALLAWVMFQHSCTCGGSPHGKACPCGMYPTSSSIALIDSLPGVQLRPECKHNMDQRWPVSPGVSGHWATLVGFPKAYLPGRGCREGLHEWGNVGVRLCQGWFVQLQLEVRGRKWVPQCSQHPQNSLGTQSEKPPVPNSCSFPGLALHGWERSLVDPPNLCHLHTGILMPT